MDPHQQVQEPGVASSLPSTGSISVAETSEKAVMGRPLPANHR